MPRFIVDIWMDGYDNEEDMAEACEAFINEQLDFTASSVKVHRIEDTEEVMLEDFHAKKLNRSK